MAKKYIKGFVTRSLVCVILFLLISIVCNFSDKNLLWFKNNIYDNNINFTFFNKIYKKYINKYLPFDLYDEKIVMSDKFVYSDKEKYLNGVKLNVGKNYNMKSLCGGIVVYIGDKEGLGNTVIIQGIDGVDYWYSNLDNLSIKLYDYIEKDVLIGNTKDEYVYLNFLKDGKYLDYEKYI